MSGAETGSMPWRSLGWVGIAVAACACVTTSRELAVNRVEIAEAAILALPEADEMPGGVAATQLLTASYEDETYTMQVELEWREGSIFLAALNTFGTVAFSLSYDGTAIAVRSNSLLDRRLSVENVLADILLTFWEHARLEARLHGDDLRLVDEPRKRTLLRRGLPVIKIEYENGSPWNGAVRFEHVERGYVLEIQTIRYDES